MIKAGFHADLVLFNPDTVNDTATYDDPQRLAAGIETVLVNGQIAFTQSQHCHAGSGQMLRYRRPAHDPLR